MCALKIVLIFRNILLCKTPLNLFFLIVWLWSSCYYPFFQIIFSPHFLWVADKVHAQNYFVFIFTNIIQTKEKMHVPVTICFPGYALNYNIHNLYCFHEWDVSLIHLFCDRHKKYRTSLFRVLRKFVMLSEWSILLGNWFACVPACTSTIAQVSLTSLHLKAKFNKTIINFIMATIAH